MIPNKDRIRETDGILMLIRVVAPFTGESSTTCYILLTLSAWGRLNI